MKTVRFAEVVKQAGAPETYQLWVAPERDRVFQRAVKEKRVMTVRQENVGTKKDYGVAGFEKAPQAEYLIFPKSIASYEGRRVVGIKYELLQLESRPGPAPAEKTSATPAWKRTPKPKGRRVERRKAAKVVEFEPPKKDKAPAPVKRGRNRVRSGRAGTSAVGWQSEVKRAIRELKAGKAVQAYERLNTLIHTAENG